MSGVVIHRGRRGPFDILLGGQKGENRSFIWYIISYKSLRSTWGSVLYASIQGFNDLPKDTTYHWHNVIAESKDPQCIILIWVETGFVRPLFQSWSPSGWASFLYYMSRYDSFILDSNLIIQAHGSQRLGRLCELWQICCHSRGK